MVDFRAWLLSPQSQLSLQLSCALLITSLFTLWKPLFFSHACLASVFAVVVIGSLAQDQHIGTRLQVSAWLLGPTWLAMLLAGSLMTLAKLASLDQPAAAYSPGYVAATAVLGFTGLGLLILLKAASPPGPSQVMVLLAVVVYGIMVILSLMYPSISSMWLDAVLLVALAVIVAAVVAMLVGWLVLPSLASDEVVRLTAEAIQGAGAILSYHTSLMMVDQTPQQHHSSHSSTNKPTSKLSHRSSNGATAPAAAAIAPAGDSKHVHVSLPPQQQQQHQHHQQDGSIQLHEEQQQQQQQQVVHQNWVRFRPQATSARSSMELAAGGAAVAAASLEMHRQASKVAASTVLNWVDADADAGKDNNSASEAASGSQISQQQHSTHDWSVSSIVGSDAAAEAAAHHLAAALQQQQTQEAVQEEREVWEEREATQGGGPAHEGPRLTEQLLLQQAEAAAGLGATLNPTDAWVCAAASVAVLSQISEDTDSTLSELATIHSSRYPRRRSLEGGHRRSLEGAASLDFMEEMDDKAFLDMNRVLSQSKQPSAAAAAAAAAAASGGTAPAAAAATTGVQESSSVGAAAGAAPVVAAGGTGLPHVKSTGSMLSAVSRRSVAGSMAGSTAGWSQAVAAPAAMLASPFEAVQAATEPRAEAPEATTASVRRLEQPRATASGTAGVLAVQQPHPAAGSIAGSIISSSHGSMLRHLWSHSMPQHAQHAAQHQYSRQQQQQMQQPLQAHRLSRSCNSSKGSHHSSQLLQGWSFISQALGHFTWLHGKSHVHQAAAPSTDGSFPHGPVSMGQFSAQFSSSPPASRELPPPTSAAQLNPLIGRAKAVLASARIEPRWLRPRGFGRFDADAWATLLDDVELLLVRLSTLEGVSRERCLMGLQLHQLAHYRGIADAFSLILAQLSAFLAHVATSVQQQEASHYVAPWLRQQPARSLCCFGTCFARQHGSKSTPQQQQQQQQDVHPAPKSSTVPLQRLTPFAAAGDDSGRAAAAVATAAAADTRSIGMSTLLSGLERQGSSVSTYLWEKKTGWATARELLRREMDAGIGHYWWAVKKASKQVPVKVPRSREVMVLLFLWPISNGMLDACQRLEASAQQVLGHNPHHLHHQQHTTGATAAQTSSKETVAAVWQRSCTAARQLLTHLMQCLHRHQQQDQQQQHVNHQIQQHQHLPVTAQQAQAGSKLMQPQASDVDAEDSASSTRHDRARGRGGAGRVWRWLQQQEHWAEPLVRLLLVQPSLVAVYRTATQQLPAALTSKKGLQGMLGSHTFQAGMKLLLASGSVLLITVLLMAYVPPVRHSVPIFGFTTVVLSFHERVEATVDRVAWRVLGTVLGACLGLAITAIPGIFHKPFLLLACMAVASAVLGLLARAQARTAVVLALLTLCAVNLCPYEAVCCSAQPQSIMHPLDTFLARIISVVGACIYAALISRLLLPWYTADYALEQLADALQHAATLFEQIYNSQLERMRLAEVVASAMKQETAVSLLAADAVVHPVHPVHPVLADATSAQAMPQKLATRHLAPEGVGTASSQADHHHYELPGRNASESAAVAADELAACEAAEAQLHVSFRQQVLGRLVAVQLTLAKDSVSWRRGVLATPPLVLSVLGAMNGLKEALASQRLALAPFTKQGAASIEAEQERVPAGGVPGDGLLHTMAHCYSLWAKPLHPLWLEILQAVAELTRATAMHLRRRPGGPARAAARAELLAGLQLLDQKRLDLRHSWLDIRVKLHRAVHVGQPWLQGTSSSATVAADSGGGGGVGGSGGSAVDGGNAESFWPTDSVHLFTFTYGVSRCLNAFAAVAQAVAANLED